MKIITDAVKDMRSNPYIGQVSFWLQRITGILLSIYLTFHICLNSTALLGRGTYDNLVTAVQTPAWHILDLAIILGVCFHLLNGLRIIFVDFLNLTRAQKPLLWGAALITTMVFFYSFFFFYGHYIFGGGH